MAVFPTSVPTDSDLYIAINTGVTALTAGIDNATLTIPANTAGFPSVGFITIDSEIIKYTSISPTQFNASLRGADGTAANSHLNGAQVNHFIIAAHHNAPKDEIIAIAQNISDRIGLSTTVLQAQVGTAALPSYTFAGDIDTGIYHPTADRIGFATAGALRWELTASGVFRTDGASPNAVFQSAIGTAALPAYSFFTDSDTGWYGLADNSMRLSLGGTQSFIFDTSSLFAPAGTAGSPTFTFVSDSNTGVYSISADKLGISAGGTNVVSVNGDSVSIFNTVNPANQLYVHKSNPADNVTIQVSNASDTASSNSRLIASVAGTSAGDPVMTWIISGGSPQQWIMGPDNSDLDSLVIAESGALGTNNRLRMPTGGQFQVVDGSAGTPTYSFISDPDTGIYRIGANQIGIVAGSVVKFFVDSAGGLNFDSAYFRGLQDGTAATPLYSFNNDQDTGTYRHGANALGFSANGALQLLVEPGQVSIEAARLFIKNGTAALPSLSFGGDQDTGILQLGTNTLDFSTGGVFAGEITASQRWLFTDGSVANPVLSFANDPDTGIYRSTGNNLAIACAGVQSLNISDSSLILSVRAYFHDGTVASPGISFNADTNTGIYRFGDGGFALVSNGTAKLSVGGDIELNTRLSPDADNTRGLGFSGRRWTELWAANGTIQTSHSSTKSNIKNLDDIEVPQGVTYERSGRKFVGYLNDTLPDDARPRNEDGSVASKENYEQAVIGVLCAAVRKLQKRVAELEGK